MILKPKYNLPETSPSMSDATALLESYREWSSNASATMTEFYTFITKPGALRRDFISSVTISGIVNAKYIIQQIS